MKGHFLRHFRILLYMDYHLIVFLYSCLVGYSCHAKSTDSETLLRYTFSQDSMISHLCQCSYINFLASSRTHLRVIITCCDKKHTPFEYLQTSGAVKSRTPFGGNLIYLRHSLWHEVIFTYVDSTAWILFANRKTKTGIQTPTARGYIQRKCC